jgi:hypothetical protein
MFEAAGAARRPSCRRPATARGVLRGAHEVVVAGRRPGAAAGHDDGAAHLGALAWHRQPVCPPAGPADFLPMTPEELLEAATLIYLKGPASTKGAP